MSDPLFVEDICGSGRYASYEFRRHLSALHYLPPGLSYLVPPEGLSAFHDAAHAHPGRLAGWLRVRRYARARRAVSWSPDLPGVPLALASSPAIANSAFLGISPDSVTSNPFSPPAGSVIFVTSFSSDPYQGDWDTSVSYPAITDSLATHLTWTLAANVYDNALSTTSNRIALWWAYCPSAQTSMTVTVTDNVTLGQYLTYMSAAVKIWTGADTGNPVGALVTNIAAASGASVSASITPQSAGSALLLAAGVDGASSDTTQPDTAGAGCYLADQGAVPCAQEWLGTSSGPALTAGTGTQTLAMSFGGTASTWQYVAYEVLAAMTGTPVSGADTSAGAAVPVQVGVGPPLTGRSWAR